MHRSIILSQCKIQESQYNGIRDVFDKSAKNITINHSIMKCTVLETTHNNLCDTLGKAEHDMENYLGHIKYLHQNMLNVE